MTVQRDPSFARKVALLAAAGLMAGITACGPAPTNEVVVSPAPPTSTAPAATGEATEATDAPEEASAAPDEPAPPPRVARSYKGVKVAKQQSGADCCKGRNECKGKGGCKTSLNECKGLNDCKGKGGCKVGVCDNTASVVVPQPPSGGQKMCCKGQNACKGLGMCKTDKHACKGLNACKGLGGCKGPC